MLITRKQATVALLVIILTSLLLHIQYMNMDVQGAHSWRQCQTMWNVNNFVRYDANILNPRISHFNGVHPENLYRYEFPVMQWSLAMIMRLLGESAWIMRIFMFLISASSVIFFYKLTRFFVRQRVARIAGSFFLTFGPVFYYYSICPLPDVLALMASIAYLYTILQYFNGKKIKYLFLASGFLLLACLVKLPFLMFSIVSIAYFVRSLYKNKRFTHVNLIQSIVQSLFLIPAIAWYVWVMPGWEGNSIVKGILDLNMSGAEIFDVIQYNILEVIPMSIMFPPMWLFFVWGLVQQRSNQAARKWIYPMIGITFLYYAFEFNAILKQHDYYLMPFIIWLYLTATIGIASFLKHSKRWKTIIICLLMTITPIYTFLTSQKKYSIQGYHEFHDAVTHRRALREAVPDDQLCLMLKDVSYYILSYQVNKRGYVFDADNIPLGWVSDMIRNKEVTHSYSNMRNFDQNPLLQHYVHKELLHAGNIKVLQFKPRDEVLQMESTLRHAVYLTYPLY